MPNCNTMLEHILLLDFIKVMIFYNNIYSRLISLFARADNHEGISFYNKISKNYI